VSGAASEGREDANMPFKLIPSMLVLAVSALAAGCIAVPVAPPVAAAPPPAVIAPAPPVIVAPRPYVVAPYPVYPVYPVYPRYGYRHWRY
jgi:hypothetical protein